jgi:hypothetical protein
MNMMLMMMTGMMKGAKETSREREKADRQTCGEYKFLFFFFFPRPTSF